MVIDIGNADAMSVVSHTGLPLSDARLLPEISILFMAGFESAHTPFSLKCAVMVADYSTKIACGAVSKNVDDSCRVVSPCSASHRVCRPPLWLMAVVRVLKAPV